MSDHSIYIQRVRIVRNVLHTAYPRTEAQWLTALAGEIDPDTALEKWEIIAFAYAAFFEARAPTDKSRHQALRVLMDCRAGYSEADIHKAAYKGLSIAEIKRLIAHFSAAEQTVYMVSRGKKAR